MMWFSDMSGVSWALMTLAMIAFWGVLVLGIVLLVRSVRGTPGAQPAPRSPEQLLAERFARGELDQSEYFARLTALRAPVRS